MFKNMTPSAWMHSAHLYNLSIWAVICLVSAGAAQAQSVKSNTTASVQAPNSAKRTAATSTATAQARVAAQATALVQAQAISEAARSRVDAAAALSATSSASAAMLPSALPSTPVGPTAPVALLSVLPTARSKLPDSSDTVPAFPSVPIPVLTPSIERPQQASHTQADTRNLAVVAGELSADQMAVAERVHLGLLPCDMGASVRIEADAARPGFFHVRGKGFRYLMQPVHSNTGAIRLEDPKAGAVWLQLANKSMLMSQTKGRRVADGCASPAQAAYALGMKNNPPNDLFDTSSTGHPKN